MLNAFEIADDVLQQAVQSISDLIKNTGFINLDFADVSAVMKDAGRAHMGVGRAAGKSKAEEAAKMAISSPLLETSINGAKGVLINVTGSMDIGLEEVETAANLVQEAEMCIRDRDLPLVIPIVGLVYVLEVLSDIIQVVYFKKTGGKRFFRMAPLHHHLELGGWSETKLFCVFSGATLILCVLAFWGVMYRYPM